MSSWSTEPPEERQAARDMRRLAREVHTPAQLEVFDLSKAGVGYRRASAVLGISRAAVRDQVTGAGRAAARAGAPARVDLARGDPPALPRLRPAHRP